MDLADIDDLELLEETEGVEFYKTGESVVISSDAIRDGADGAAISFDTLVNVIGELETTYRDDNAE